MADQKPVQPNKQSTPSAKSGYGKRPIWQWVALYVIVAAIVYFAVYLIFFHHTGTSGSGSTGTFGY